MAREAIHRKGKLSKQIKALLQVKLLPFPSYLFIKILWLTIKADFVHGDNLASFLEKKKPFILAFWHGTLLLMVHAFKSEKRTFLVSFHRDGELITRVIKKFGIEATRGSTTKGGTKALLSLVRRARHGYSIAFTPDGPRGPQRKVQQGIIELARISSIPIIPVGFWAGRAKKLNSWDSFIVPYPFSKVAFCYGKPIFVSEENKKKAVKVLEEALNEAEEKAKSACYG